MNNEKLGKYLEEGKTVWCENVFCHGEPYKPRIDGKCPHCGSHKEMPVTHILNCNEILRQLVNTTHTHLWRDINLEKFPNNMAQQKTVVIK